MVTLSDAITKQRRVYYLGAYGSDASYELYYRLVRQWKDAGRRLFDQPERSSPAKPAGPLIGELVLQYFQHIRGFYSRLERCTSARHSRSSTSILAARRPPPSRRATWTCCATR